MCDNTELIKRGGMGMIFNSIQYSIFYFNICSHQGDIRQANKQQNKQN